LRLAILIFGGSACTSSQFSGKRTVFGLVRRLHYVKEFEIKSLRSVLDQRMFGAKDFLGEGL